VTVRVLVVDDSRTSRALLSGLLSSDPQIEVVGEAADGAAALSMVAALRPSLVVMDVRMRGMDGFEATERIMASHPTPIVIVTAGHDARDVEMGVRALRAGALTILPKPGGPGTPAGAAEAAHLRSLVRALADVRVVRRRRRVTSASSATTPAAGLPSDRTVAAIGVAVSTGGPVALQGFLTALPRDLGVPVAVVQHIATGFVHGLASWLATATGLDVQVAVDKTRLRAGSVYLAPEDRHLEMCSGGTVSVSKDPPVRGFRPSGSVLLRTLAQVHGPQAAAVVLSGMGNDGLEGARAVRDAGGVVLAQDEATSAVFGMPKAVIDAGLAAHVGSAPELAYALTPLLPRQASRPARRPRPDDDTTSSEQR
jgi:two-component system chemotaxis response regulator CheB